MSAPHDPPSAAQLVEAVREFLETDILGGVEGRVRFHTLVAVNALRIVERELVMGDEPARAHAERLAALGVADEADLAKAIREGRLDDRLDETLAVVRATVRAKLEVANPAYPTAPR